jgi:Helix-turn-helix domain
MSDHLDSHSADRERRKEELVRGLSMELIQLEPWYLDIRSEIVKPDQVAIQTKYFWEHWAQKLGPLQVCLLLRLRQYCYYNRATGERRDWCFPSQETLGKELGVHDETVRAALRKLEVLGFVRREKQYRYDAVAHRSIRTTDKYFVLMEEPVAPEDEGTVLTLAAERMLSEASKPSDSSEDPRKAKFSPYGRRAVDNRSLRAKFSPQYAGEESASKKSDLEGVLKTLNVSKATKERVTHSSHLAGEILGQLGDRHSMGFYRKVVQLLPEPAIYAALSEVKDARLTGRLKESAGAYFTFLVKMAAKVRGIAL